MHLLKDLKLIEVALESLLYSAIVTQESSNCGNL